MKHLFLLLLIINITGCTGNNKEQQKQPPTNILFLFADDQRGHTIRALGNDQVITPNLDKLVKGGTSFDNTYVMGSMVGAVCAPSRAMLMTGRTLFNIDPTGHSIDTSHVTLPKTLSSVDYNTFHIGKWHNGRPAFNRSFGDGSKIFFGGMHSQYNVPTYEYNMEEHYDKSHQNELSPVHSSELYADAAVNFLENYSNENPFFMYVAFQAPHDPREMPKKYLDMYDVDSITLPPNYMPQHPFDNGELDIRDEWLAGYPRTEKEVKANIAAYYAMITHLDEQIGRILQTLEEKGLAENTLIVFAGDNGLAVGQHGLMGKQNLYEHSVGVPLIFAGPGVPKGEQREALSYLSDLYPTFCAVTGADVPETVQGKSLWKVVQGKESSVRNSSFFVYKNFQRAARNNQWKIIKYNVGDKVTTQLFDLKNDPFEINNLAGNPTYANQLKDMENLLAQKMLEENDKADLSKPQWGVAVLPAWKDRVKPEIVEHLREMAKEEREKRGFVDEN
ncbi:sulfatase-like hydrolase/transferase [Flagellimonas sp. CMM7]|uniref:sulfatase-like hydrolase/transferase n=1 Tax=Flagellimonas sp. CMM7 TaxID=2654676 RepID=UPI0013D4420B|nr:sulfatase-like hydrolase/transferase [Flagellimonas sp. CMM7]UII78745.1 sulfatase-like hydrolase/transferase [Flagellimonas sp. CMM7]